MRLKAIGMILPVILCAGGVFAADAKRSYSGALYLLTLDGNTMDYLKSVEGGGVKGNVVQEALSGPNHSPKKHTSTVEYEPFAVQLGLGAPAALYEWIDASMHGAAKPRSVTLAECAVDFGLISESTTNGALITEVGFPAIGAQRKEPVFLSLKFISEETRRKAGSGKCAAPTLASKQKAWIASYFRFELDGIDAKSVSAIAPFTVKPDYSQDTIGVTRETTLQLAKVIVPNLTLTVGRGGAQDFEAWADDFLVKGNNSDEKEKSGAIVFTDQTMQKELARVTLGHVGVAGLSPSADGTDVNVTLYVESMRFTVGGAKPKEAKLAAAASKAAPLKLAPAKAVKRKP
jgi:hypothetical protein